MYALSSDWYQVRGTAIASSVHQGTYRSLVCAHLHHGMIQECGSDAMASVLPHASPKAFIQLQSVISITFQPQVLCWRNFVEPSSDGNCVTL